MNRAVLPLKLTTWSTGEIFNKIWISNKLFCVSISVFLKFLIAKWSELIRSVNPILFLSIKLLLPSAIFTRLSGNTINVNIAPCNYIKTSLDVKTYISSFIKKLSSNWYNKFKITGGFLWDISKIRCIIHSTFRCSRGSSQIEQNAREILGSNILYTKLFTKDIFRLKSIIFRNTYINETCSQLG